MNKALIGGGGIGRAVNEAAESGLLCECQTLNSCETGDCRATLGYIYQLNICKAWR